MILPDNYEVGQDSDNNRNLTTKGIYKRGFCFFFFILVTVCSERKRRQNSRIDDLNHANVIGKEDILCIFTRLLACRY